MRGSGFGRRREDARRHVRRPARFHAPLGEAAAVRHRLRAERVLRRRRRRDHRRTAAGSTSSSATGCSPCSASATAIEIGCRQALRTARAIDLALDHINAKLEAELGRPLQVGIGIDAGPLLLGRIGYGEAVDFTVIGNAVNVASRLEALTKEKGCSSCCRARWRSRPAGSRRRRSRCEVAVRGVAEPIEVIGLARGRDLPATILVFTDEEKENGPWRGPWAAGEAERDAGRNRSALS